VASRPSRRTGLTSNSARPTATGVASNSAQAATAFDSAKYTATKIQGCCGRESGESFCGRHNGTKSCSGRRRTEAYAPAGADGKSCGGRRRIEASVAADVESRIASRSLGRGRKTNRSG
jgi:hypothetical protein